MSLANPTPTINLERQLDGTNANTWNDRYNANYARVDQAIAGITQVDMTAGSVTLTIVDSGDLNADDQQRSAVVKAVGTPSGPTTISMAALIGKQFLFINSSSGTVTFNVTGQTGVTLISGSQALVFNNGIDIVYSIAQIGVTSFGGTDTWMVAPLGSSPIAGQTYGVHFGQVFTEMWSDGLTNTPLAIGTGSGVRTLVQFHNGSSVVGSIGFNGSATVYNTTSDYRLKTTYGAADAGALIDAIKVHDGAFNSDPDARRPMFLAHELQEVAPWAVTGERDAVDEDGKIKPQMVDHSGFVPALIAELQSLRRRVAQLEAR